MVRKVIRDKVVHSLFQVQVSWLQEMLNDKQLQYIINNQTQTTILSTKNSTLKDLTVVMAATNNVWGLITIC